MENKWLNTIFEALGLTSNGDWDDAHQCDDELVYLMHGGLHCKDSDLSNDGGASHFGHNMPTNALKEEFDRLYNLAYY